MGRCTSDGPCSTAGAEAAGSPKPRCSLGASGTRPRAVAADLRRVHPEPAGEVANVADVERLIPDARDDRRGRPQRGDPPLDRVEVVAGEHAPDHELEHRLLGLDQTADGVVAALEPQVAGVEATGRDGDEGLRGEALLLAEGSARGLLARLIRVEGEDDLPGARGVDVVHVAEHAAHHLDVIDAEGRPAGGDRRGDPGEVAGHDVGVTLHHHDLATAGDVPLGEIESVEHLGLVIDRRLGGVEVFGPLVVIQQLARAEAEGLAGDVADRPDQPAAEPVVGAPVALADEAGGEQLRLGVAEGLEVRAQGVVALRGESDPEALGRRRIEPALAEERTGRFRIRSGQLGDEVFRGGLVRREDAGTVAVVAVGLPAILVVQLEAHPGGHALHGFAEARVVHLL
jgi:hypothetical protein